MSAFPSVPQSSSSASLVSISVCDNCLLMNILAIETCFGKFSVAVFQQGKLAAHFASDEENKQAEKLIPAIEQILAETNLTYPQLDKIAVGIGPGSFTGIRIGLAAAKGIALALNKPLIGVSTLDAAAVKKGSYPVYLNASRAEAFSKENAAAEAVLIPYDGEYDQPPTAVEVGQIALSPNAQNLTPEPLYVRQPDAKLPVRNS